MLMIKLPPPRRKINQPPIMPLIIFFVRFGDILVHWRSPRIVDTTILALPTSKVPDALWSECRSRPFEMAGLVEREFHPAPKWLLDFPVTPGRVFQVLLNQILSQHEGS